MNLQQRYNDFIQEFPEMEPFLEKARDNPAYAAFCVGLIKNYEKEYSEGGKYLLSSAEMGLDSLYSMGCMYEKGEGVEQNHASAFEYFVLAATLGVSGVGSSKAQAKLGAIYQLGKLGIPKNDKKSFEWYSRTAEQNHKWAQYRLAIMYESGISVQPDPQKAFEWMTNAADEEDAFGLYGLAHYYKTGLGTRKNINKAIKLYKQAVEKGLPHAMVSLGKLCALGRVRGKNLDDGLTLLFKAESVGHKESSEVLGRLYTDLYTPQAYEEPISP